MTIPSEECVRELPLLYENIKKIATGLPISSDKTCERGLPYFTYKEAPTLSAIPSKKVNSKLQNKEQLIIYIYTLSVVHHLIMLCPSIPSIVYLSLLRQLL
jgi:hypothetical protein